MTLGSLVRVSRISCCITVCLSINLICCGDEGDSIPVRALQLVDIELNRFLKCNSLSFDYEVRNSYKGEPLWTAPGRFIWNAGRLRTECDYPFPEIGGEIKQVFDGAKARFVKDSPKRRIMYVAKEYPSKVKHYPPWDSPVSTFLRVFSKNGIGHSFYPTTQLDFNRDDAADRFTQWEMVEIADDGLVKFGVKISETAEFRNYPVAHIWVDSEEGLIRKMQFGNFRESEGPRQEFRILEARKVDAPGGAFVFPFKYSWAIWDGSGEDPFVREIEVSNFETGNKVDRNTFSLNPLELGISEVYDLDSRRWIDLPKVE